MESHTPARGPLPDALLAPPLVSEALAARVRALLPDDWREGVRVVRIHDGFAVGFRDADGGQHVLRAQWQESGAPAFVQGRRFDFSALKNSVAPETDAVVARYREVAETLLAHEDELAQNLLPVGAIDPSRGFDLLAQPSASEALTARVLALLPAEAQADARVVLMHDGFAVGFRDEAGALQVLRAQQQDANAPVLVRGGRFGFSYQKDGEGPASAITVARYREVAEALRAHEDQFAQDLLVSAAESGEARLGFGFLTPPPASEALAATVRAQLPTDWREDVQVVLAPGGFAVGFRDASGVQHELRAWWLEEGFASLAQGRRFDLSYLKNEEALSDATVERLRRAAETLLEVEDQIAQDLQPTADNAGLDLLAQPTAGNALVALVRSLLPVDWRKHAKVVLAPGGFAVGFRDGAGVQHGLRARGLGEGFLALERGRRFGLSYLQDPTAPRTPATVARYHTVAQSLLAHEELLARDLEPTPPATAAEDGAPAPHPRFDLLAQPPADEELTARVRALLPDEAHPSARVVLVHDGFAVGFRDAAGDAHVLRAQWLDEEAPTLARSQRFDFSYLTHDGAPKSPITVARYREVAEALRSHEEQLAHALLPTAEGGSAEPAPGASLLAPQAASEALTAVVRALLPDDWREDVQVVLAPGGFAVGFRDLSGERHGLRVQWLEEGFPVLVEGQRLRVSYWKDDSLPERAEATALDRSVAQRVIDLEQDLAHALHPTDTDAAPRGFELFGPPHASEALTARVRALMPEDWRDHLQVVRLRDGFALGFNDAEGRQHVLRAQWQEADAPTLLRGLGEGFLALGRGRRFGLSYLQDPTAPRTPATVARYHTVAQSLLAHEELLARDLEPTPPATAAEDGAPAPHPRFDLLAQPPADEELTARVRALLPDEVHPSARVVLVHDGFAVGFRDAAGDAHILRAQWLDEEAPTLARSQRFDFSYLTHDGAPQRPITVARYREVAEALRSHEEQLAHALLQTDEGESGEPAPGASPLAPQAASEALAAVVRAQLPDDWHEDVQVVLAPGGFAVRFRDLSGEQHGLRVQWLEEGFPVLVEGQRLRVSYWKDDSLPERAEATALDRSVAQRVIDHEQDLAHALRPTDTDAAPRGSELFGPPHASEALTARVRALMPEDWREHLQVLRLHDGFALGFSDAEGLQHVLRAQWQEADTPTLFRGRHLRFCLLKDDEAPRSAAAVAQARTAAEALLAHEEQLIRRLRAVGGGEGSDVGVGDAGWGLDLLTQSPASEPFATTVRALLPTDWRERAKVVLAPGGFAVGFRDDKGVQHGLRIQRLEEGFSGLLQGRRLGFSYKRVARASAEAELVTRYRAVAEAILAEEDQIAGWGLDLHAQPPASESLVTQVQALLPAEWRSHSWVVLVPDGFALGFRDAADAQHVLWLQRLEEDFTPFERGQHLAFSYLRGRDEAGEDVLRHYRAAVADLLGQEDQIAQDLRATTPSPSIDFFTPPPSNEALAARVRALLPADWRRDARLALHRDGFVVGLRDDTGALHVLRAKRQEEAFAHLAYGRRFAVSYLRSRTMSGEAGADVTERAAAEALLAQEDLLASEFHSGGAGAPGEGGADEVQRILGLSPTTHASEALVARIRGLLPVDWLQNLEVVVVPGGFAVGFRDAAGVQHGLRARARMEGHTPLVQGRRFDFSYLKSNNEPDDPMTVVRYRDVLLGFLAQEDQIAEDLQPTASP